MPSNHKASAASAEPATLEASAPADDENVNLDDYAARADLPTYAAPVEPSFSFPLVLYGKGVTVVSGRNPYKLTSFLLETEQSAEVDGLFEEQGAPAVRIRHRNGTEGVYWQLESIKGYFLFTAVPDGYGPDAWKHTGIPYVWNPHQGTYMYGSQLQCFFFSQGLMMLDHHQPLVLSFSRTVTDHFVKKVLRRQEAFITAIKKALVKHGKSDAIGIYAYWAELCKGEEVTVKEGGSYFAPGLNMPSPFTVAAEQTAEQAQRYDGPYSPPARQCYICKRRAWRWNGQSYECGSGDPAHAERERHMQAHPEKYYAFWKSNPKL